MSDKQVQYVVTEQHMRLLSRLLHAGRLETSLGQAKFLQAIAPLVGFSQRLRVIEGVAAANAPERPAMIEVIPRLLYQADYRLTDPTGEREPLEGAYLIRAESPDDAYVQAYTIGLGTERDLEILSLRSCAETGAADELSAVALGSRIRRIRLAKDLRLIDVGGSFQDPKDASRISMWETGKACPRVDNLVELARILGCKVEDFFGDGA